MNWIWAVGAPLVRAVIGLVFRVRIEGVEHVPRTGAVILAPNHVSVIDGPAVSAVTGAHRRRATHNLIAGEVFAGITGWILRQARQIPIRRGTGDTGALDAATRAIEDGWVVGIFPEGRVNEDPRGPCSASAPASRGSPYRPRRPSCPSGSGARSRCGRKAD